MPGLAEKGSRAGMTLMELMLVLSLMALLTLFSVPNFQNMLQGPLDKEVNHLAGVIRLLRNEAVLGNHKFRLVFDLTKKRFTVEQLEEDGFYAERTEPKMMRPHPFPPAFDLSAAIIFGRTYRPEDRIPVAVHIDSSGYIDPFLIQFTIEKTEFTFRVTGFTGRVDLVSGHVER